MSKLILYLEKEDVEDYVWSKLEGIAHFNTITNMTFSKKYGTLKVEVRDDV